MKGSNELENVPVEAMDETQILSSLLWLSELIGTKTDVDELLELVVELTPKLINLNRCSIMLWDTKAKEFIPRVSFSPEREERKKHLAGFYAMRVHINEIPELAKKLINEKVPVVIKDAKKSKQIPKKYVDFFGIKSALVLPLLCGDNFIGVMILDHIKDFHHFTQSEIRVAMGLSNQAALAIRNAQLISSLKEEQDKTRQIIETMAEGLMVVTPDKRVVMTNSEMERISGLAREEILGLSCETICNGGIVNEYRNCCSDLCPLVNNQDSTMPISIEGGISTRDHRDIQLSANHSHVHDIDGNLVYTVITVRNLSEIRRAESNIDHMFREFELSKVGERKDDGTSSGGF